MFWSVEDTLDNCEILQGNLLEFGIYHADTMNRLVNGKRLLNHYWEHVNFTQVWGFDSFEGLPVDAVNDGNPDWKEGSFNVVKDDNFASDEEAVEFIRNKVNHPELHLVKGWFKDTLTTELGLMLLNSCSYAHIDCDIFSSTRDCLDWLLKYDVMKHGCVMRFDDWHSYMEYHTGQPKAWLLMKSKYYNKSFRRVSDNVFIYNGSE